MVDRHPTRAPATIDATMRARHRPGHTPNKAGIKISVLLTRSWNPYLPSPTCARGLPRFARMEGGSATGGISVKFSIHEPTAETRS